MGSRRAKGMGGAKAHGSRTIGGKGLDVSLVLTAALMLGAGTAPAAELFRSAQPDPNRANTSRAARDSAVQSVPFDKLTPDGRNKANWVLHNTSLYRRLPIRMIQCDPELYVFLVQHPDVVVNIWEVLDVSRLTMREMGPGVYRVTDEIGTVGMIEYLYHSNDTQVIYVDGTYQGSMFGHQVRGRGLLVLKSGMVQEADGRCYVTSRLDAFMNVEPDTAEFLTKTFQPMVGKVADTNFTQTVSFVACLWRTIQENNAGVQRLATRLTKVQPATRQQFAQLSEKISQKGKPAGPTLSAGLVPIEAETGAARVALRPAAGPAAPATAVETGAARIALRPAAEPTSATTSAENAAEPTP